MNDENKPGNGHASAPNERDHGALVAVRPAESGRRTGRTLGAASLVVALVAAGTAAYLWSELEQTRTRADVNQDAMAEQIAGLEASAARQSADLTKALQDTEATSRQGRDLKGVVDDLRSRLGRDRNDWLLAEVDYLLTFANRRLRFERDFPAAAAALEEATARLATLNEPALVPVRAAIADELELLRAVAPVDRSGLALQITSLMHSVPALPLAAELTPAEPAPAAETAEPAVDSWRGFFDALWADLKGLVSIHRRDERVVPLLPAEQRYFLEQNLTLKLDAARLALLQREAAVYQATLTEAEDWVKRYYNTDAAPTRALLDSLARLKKVQIAPPIPDISGSLRVLRRTVRELTPPRAESET